MTGVAAVSSAPPPDRARGRRRRRLRLALLVSLVSLALLAGTREGRTALRAVALVPYVFPDPPARPLAWVTPAPIHEEVQYTDGRRELVADLYRPGRSGRYGGMVLSLGVHPVPRDEPALVQFSQGLARDGYLVLIPESPDLRADRILPSERDALVAAFRYLSRREDVDPERLGFVGFSVGASLVTVAAADPRINREVRMVNFFGGYYDARDALRAIASRRFSYAGVSTAWEPAELAVTIFANVLAEHIEDPDERERVRRALVDKVDLEPAEFDRLGPRARLVYELFTVGDARRVDQLVEQLPADLQEQLRAVSPSTYARELRARMYLMHDRGDSFVPYVESRRFAEQLPPRQREYTEFSIFAHVQPTTQATDTVVFLADLAKLVRHIYLVLLELSD